MIQREEGKRGRFRPVGAGRRGRIRPANQCSGRSVKTMRSLTAYEIEGAMIFLDLNVARPRHPSRRSRETFCSPSADAFRGVGRASPSSSAVLAACSLGRLQRHRPRRAGSPLRARAASECCSTSGQTGRAPAKSTSAHAGSRAGQRRGRAARWPRPCRPPVLHGVGANLVEDAEPRTS